MKRAREYHCNKSSDSFCYICGQWTPISGRRPITHQIRDLYQKYFNIEILNEDKCWVPHYICSKCRLGLHKWSKNQGHLSFGKPMLWRDPINHQTNCYICLTKVSSYSRRTKDNVKYAVVDSVTLPVPHSANLPVPLSPAQCGDHDDSSSTEDDLAHDNPAYQHPEDPLYIADTGEPYTLSQGDLNDLVRDLNLGKEMSELLASRLQEWKLLKKDVRVTAGRERSAHLAKWFSQKDKICYCNDILKLFDTMKEPCYPHEWRLFIDGSKTSIKAVLLNIGNRKPSIPVAFAIGMKEEYTTMKSILELIQYKKFNFKIVADFKVIAVLMGLQSGYTTHCCFLCLWDSRAYSEHYKRKYWPPRTNYLPDKTLNVIAHALVPRERIILPPLHIKLGLMTNFVKAVRKTNIAAIDYLDVSTTK